MHAERLSPLTAALLSKISVHCPEIGGLPLVGGTALSLRLGHRLSEDMDFASARPKLDRKLVKSILAKLQSLGSDVRFNTSQEAMDHAINEGVDLDDYHQDWLIDQVKVTFFCFGDSEREKCLLAETECLSFGYVKVPALSTLFDMKCLALTQRIKSRDLFDLWWLTHRYVPPYPVIAIFQRIENYRPHLQYEHLRYRLLDWKLPANDEGFAALIDEDLTIEKIRRDFRVAVDQIDIEIARNFAATAARSNKDES